MNPTENKHLAREAFNDYQGGEIGPTMDAAELVAAEVAALIRQQYGLSEDFDLPIHDDFGFADAIAVAVVAGMKLAQR